MSTIGSIGFSAGEFTILVLLVIVLVVIARK